MTTALKSPPKTTSLASLQDTATRLDEIANGSGIDLSTGSSFAQAITTATGIIRLRQELTPQIMEEVFLPLMNSKLGFRTDKDPSRGYRGEPYPMETVRECIIEATLRGLPSVGNCYNIIAGNAYVTKEGFWFLLGKRTAGLTDFKILVGVPKMIKAAGDARNASDEEAKGALVTCSASWKLNGTLDRLEREIPIRVNAMMGADAIMGKAERKLLAAAHAQITGTVLGDADAAEAEPSMRTVTPTTTSQVPTGEGFTTTEPVEPEPPTEKPVTAAPTRSADRPTASASDASPEAGSILAYYESVQVKRSKPDAPNPWVQFAVSISIPLGPSRVVFTDNEAIGNAIADLEEGARIRLWLVKDGKFIERFETASEGGAA
ncbi:MAG: hypothetical protein JWO82_1665 [Akkermansiaceae bacterium]|nr:hypothetical protein [Akkermansiaceae bacterium]